VLRSMVVFASNGRDHGQVADTSSAVDCIVGAASSM
jgi:hypothetical protein